MIVSGTFGQQSEKEYQGIVTLQVEATDSARSVISFLTTLRQKPCVRLLEIAGTADAGVDIRMELRKPMHLISALRQIEGVSKVEVPKDEGETGDEPQFKLQLAGMAYARTS